MPVDRLSMCLQSPKEKRKVGRPIIYSGDPDAPNLTPQERRRIRRRIANRESARRVRAKRQDLIEEMSIKVCTAVHPNSLRGTSLLLGEIYFISSQTSALAVLMLVTRTMPARQAPGLRM